VVIDATRALLEVVDDILRHVERRDPDVSDA
jgi:hypothetical protein